MDFGGGVSLPYDRARARDYHPAGRDNPAPGHQGHRDAYRAEVVFEEQRSKGIGVWREPFSTMRVPKLYNLRSDPFEAGDDAILYDQWTVDHVFYPGTHTGTRGQMAGDFQGLSAPSQTRKLQRRPDN